MELAGALGEMRKNILPKDYPELDFRKMQIHLFEAGPRLLAAMHPENSDKALKYVKDFGVNVWLNTMVTGYNGQEINLSNGKIVRSGTVIWTAGVKGNPIAGLPETAKAGGNRILVDEFCRVKDTENIFAVGDVACMIQDKFPKGHPMVAPVAIQQGDLVAKNILLLMKGKDAKPFVTSTRAPWRPWAATRQ